jgi:ABC-type bacteriocin/lantibiotic exporter with double-glycine peptidase domain
MESSEALQQLVALARDAGLEVRSIAGRSAGEGEPAAASAVCRVRGETWVVLSAADSLDERVAVLARALRERAAEFLETRYLPPALRVLLAPEEDAG